LAQKNIMTVDLEDYFCDLDFNEWPNYASRITETTNLLLELFKKNHVKATFFTLGYIAEKFPELIESIVREGHEIASHSYSHLDIRKATKEQFESDLLKSLKILENISGEKIYGFRAPFFSINKKTFWAFKILRKYLRYDSSIFPTKTPLYGIPDAPRKIFHPSLENPLINDETKNFIELPLATHHLPVIGNIPIAGGFHLRFLPYMYIKYSIKRINKENSPAVCYIHPKDLDKKMPRISQYSWHFYYGLNHAENKFRKLLNDFNFHSIRDFMELN